MSGLYGFKREKRLHLGKEELHLLSNSPWLPREELTPALVRLDTYTTNE